VRQDTVFSLAKGFDFQNVGGSLLVKKTNMLVVVFYLVLGLFCF
jgi:hypothetical protein